MSAEDIAFVAAQESIRQVAAGPEMNSLILTGERYRSLRSLPPEISNLGSLASLSLADTQVADLSPLERLDRLHVLNMDNTRVADLGPLHAHTALSVLSLNNTLVADLAPLRALIKLESLNLENTPVADLAPLQSLKSLSTLIINNTNVENLTPLENLSNLHIVGLAGSRVNRLKSLGNLTAIDELYLDNCPVNDLSPLSKLLELTFLSLNGTQVHDLIPLERLPRLAWLELAETRVSDLAPIRRHALQRLVLDNAAGVIDLRAVKDMNSLVRGATGGSHRSLSYLGCGACALDPEGLGRLAQIRDDNERTEATLTYLRELNEWPPRPNDVPKQDDILVVGLNAEGKLDIAPAHPGPKEAAERLKLTLLQRLQDAFDELERATGNQQPDVSRRARVARLRFAGEFAKIDLIQIYLEVAWARAEYDRRSEREGEERFTKAAIAALNEIVTIGPGLVLDNPEIEKLEDRRRRFQEDPLPPEVGAAQEAVAERIANELELFGETIRSYAQASLGARSEASDRRSLLQRPLTRNAAIFLGTMAVSGVVGGAAYDGALAAARWVVGNEGVIRTAALGWGEMFLAWLGLVIDQARVITAAAQSSGVVHPVLSRWER